MPEPVGRTIALDVGADDVVTVVPEIAIVVITLDVDFATNSCEFEVTVVACVKPPTFIPKEPIVDTEAGTGIADGAVEAVTLRWVGNTGPVGFVGGDSDLAPNSTH